MKRKHFIGSTASAVFISRPLLAKAARLGQSPSWRNPEWFCSSAVVWLEAGKNVYYYEGSRLYGRTEHYACEKEALAAGHRASTEAGKGW